MVGELYGKLFNYPECCITFFIAGGSYLTNGGISYNGYNPCSKCAELPLEILEQIVGRDFADEPIEVKTLDRNFNLENLYEIGLEIYREADKEQFFINCWNKAKELEN